MRTDIEKMTKSALEKPKRGDHWTEMFNWDLFVVGRYKDLVYTLEGSRPCNYPNTCEAKIRKLSEFIDFLSYKSHNRLMSGTWAKCIERNANVTGWKKNRFSKNKKD